MAGTTNLGFWKPRRTPLKIDVATRCRPNRMRTSAILRPRSTSVNFQVETFRIYGRLRETTTEVHNSLPTFETIETEKTLMSFENKRRTAPDGANYDDFYRSLVSTLTPSGSRQGTARTARSGVLTSARSVDTRNTTLFTLAPANDTTHDRPLESRQSVFSRLGTSYYNASVRQSLQSRGYNTARPSTTNTNNGSCYSARPLSFRPLESRLTESSFRPSESSRMSESRHSESQGSEHSYYNNTNRDSRPSDSREGDGLLSGAGFKMASRPRSGASDKVSEVASELSSSFRRQASGEASTARL